MDLSSMGAVIGMFVIVAALLVILIGGACILRAGSQASEGVSSESSDLAQDRSEKPTA